LRSGQKIFDLGVFGKATDQAKQALGFSDEYKVPAIYAMGRDIRDNELLVHIFFLFCINS
jgi:hypothetical protein